MPFRFSFARTALAATAIIHFASVGHSTTDFTSNLNWRLQYASRFDDSIDDKKQSKEPSEIWQGLESEKWPDALQPFQARFQFGKSYLTLFTKLPHSPIDMRSPDRFKRSMTAGEITNRSSIGHMAIGWSCTSSQSSSSQARAEGFAAQTGEDGQQPEMLNNGWGATALISTFTDGRLQNGAEVQRYFASGYRKSFESGDLDRFYALVFEVPEQDCARVRDFVKNYVFHPAKPYRNFGMRPNPLKFEGAGCGSFAVSALSHATALEPILSQFWRTLPVAEKLLGRRTRAHLPNDVAPFVYAKVAAEEDTISKYRLILMNWDSGKIATQLHVVDPELTILSIRKFAEIATSTANQSASITATTQPTSTALRNADLKSLRRIYNFAASNSEVQIDDKDSGYQEIGAEFDPSFERVSTSVDRWWSARAADSQINLIDFPLGVGVMVEAKP